MVHNYIRIARRKIKLLLGCAASAVPTTVTVAARISRTCARKCTTVEKEGDCLDARACEMSSKWCMRFIMCLLKLVENISISFSVRTTIQPTRMGTLRLYLYTVCILLLVAYIIYYTFIVESASIFVVFCSIFIRWTCEHWDKVSVVLSLASLQSTIHPDRIQSTAHSRGNKLTTCIFN